jgi:hypothetical protein
LNIYAAMYLLTLLAAPRLPVKAIAGNFWMQRTASLCNASQTRSVKRDFRQASNTGFAFRLSFDAFAHIYARSLCGAADLAELTFRREQ